jgi:hypothetical protein
MNARPRKPPKRAIFDSIVGTKTGSIAKKTGSLTVAAVFALGVSTADLPSAPDSSAAHFARPRREVDLTHIPQDQGSGPHFSLSSVVSGLATTFVAAIPRRIRKRAQAAPVPPRRPVRIRRPALFTPAFVAAFIPRRFQKPTPAAPVPPRRPVSSPVRRLLGLPK